MITLDRQSLMRVSEDKAMEEFEKQKEAVCCARNLFLFTDVLQVQFTGTARSQNYGNTQLCSFLEISSEILL